MIKDYCSLNGISYYYEYYNNHEEHTIIFLHDSLGCTSLWRDFPQKIADLTHSNYFVYDRQGYGLSQSFNNTNRPLHYMQSEAELLLQIIQKFGFTNVSLYGHSDGGTIALLAATMKSFCCIIAEGVHVFVEELTLKGIRAVKELYLTSNLKSKLEKYHFNNTDALFNMWVERWLSPEFKFWNIEDALFKINSPLLLIQGEHDEFGTMEQVRKTLALVKGITDYLIVPNATHTTFKKMENVVLPYTAAFINQQLSKI